MLIHFNTFYNERDESITCAPAHLTRESWVFAKNILDKLCGESKTGDSYTGAVLYMQNTGGAGTQKDIIRVWDFANRLAMAEKLFILTPDGKKPVKA